MNDLHKTMGLNGYTEIYVSHVAESVVAVTRRSPRTLNEITCVAHLVSWSD